MPALDDMDAANRSVEELFRLLHENINPVWQVVGPNLASKGLDGPPVSSCGASALMRGHSAVGDGLCSQPSHIYPAWEGKSHLRILAAPNRAGHLCFSIASE